MEHMEIAAEQACRQIKDRKYLEVLYRKGYTAVSYTHLDVYKRQGFGLCRNFNNSWYTGFSA